MPLTDDDMDGAAERLFAMANPHRLAIIRMLRDGEMSVGALNREIDLTQSALSQHLAVLRAQGLVSARRQSQAMYYSVASTFAIQILSTLEKLYTF